jgi:hypothetical protein
VTLGSYSPSFDSETPWGYIDGLAPARITYEYVDISLVSIDTGSGADTVNVLATGTGTTTWLFGNSDLTTVNVGNAGSVQGIQGELRVESLGTHTTLNVHDTADGGYRTVWHGSYSPSFDNDSPWGYIDGLAPARITYEYLDTSNATISTGVGGATVNVLATGALGGGGTLTLSGNSNNTNVNVGNGWDGVQEIYGNLYIQNPPWYTRLNINDGANSFDRNIFESVNGSTATISGLAPGQISFAVTDVSALNIKTGSGVDHVIGWQSFAFGPYLWQPPSYSTNGGLIIFV